jgi:putative sterol carrier protein
VHFPSAEWAAAYRSALNSNEAYRAAAGAWEGDILLLVQPPDSGTPAPGIHLELAHGDRRSATFYADARAVVSEFVYEGTAENWRRLLHHELDPVRALLDGTFLIRGNLAKAMRYTRAAKELVETAASIPSDD